MRFLFRILLLLSGLSGTAQAAAEPGQDGFIILSYHEVKPEVTRDVILGLMAVSTANLEAHFNWLKDNGYHVISLDDVLKARDRKQSLPDKSVMLTFDDGYRDFYDNAYPLLKKFNYPAVLALVGSWMSLKPGDEVPLGGDRALKREALLTWDQVREMSRSGLVEIASHSHDLHHGILGNPQGNQQPAAVTRLYDAASQHYEDDRTYARRLDQELKLSTDFIQKETGKRPRVMVWPYGEYNAQGIALARKHGMTMTMGLREGRNDFSDLPAMKRMLVTDNPKIPEFASIVTTLRKDKPIRVAHVDIDYLYDPDPRQIERNLDVLLERIDQMEVSAVFLQAYADPDGDGNADSLYFPNRYLPVRADLFNRVAWQLHSRSRVRVYAWMPILAFKLDKPDSLFVHEWVDGKSVLGTHIYKRLSPFNPESRQLVKDLYEDLAKYCNFNGILFHDDGILSDFEDSSPQALAYGRKHWGLPDSVEKLRKPDSMRMRWAEHKTALINGFTDELASLVREYRPELKTARNIYALPLMQPSSEDWYAQNFARSLEHYDYVAIEAMPFMEKAENPDAWLQELVSKVASYPDGLRKTVIELQAVDWNTQKDIPMETMIHQIELVEKAGAVHLAYYPDNLHHDHPRFLDMRRVFAAPWTP
jgi:biofilm PGA synthesis lipoprotein PgaB